MDLIDFHCQKDIKKKRELFEKKNSILLDNIKNNNILKLDLRNKNYSSFDKMDSLFKNEEKKKEIINRKAENAHNLV